MFFNNRVYTLQKQFFKYKPLQQVAKINIGNFMNLIDALERLHTEDKNNLRKKSFQTYSSKISAFRVWLKENDMEEITAQDFDYLKAKAFLSQMKREPATRKSYKRILSKYFSELVQEGVLTSNPFLKVKLPQTTSPNSLRAFRKSEIELIKAYCLEYDVELWQFVQMQYYTMIRPNELRNMMVQDIDFESGKIWVRGEFSKNKRKQSVVIPDNFVQSLRTIVENKKLYHYIFGDNQCRGSNYFNYRHNLALHELGLKQKDVALYSWKHTGATHYYQATKDLIGLMRQCRHTHTDITQRYLESLGVLDNPEIKGNFPTI